MHTRHTHPLRPLGISLARLSSSVTIAAAMSLACAGRLHADPPITLNGNTLALTPLFTADAANAGFAGFYYNNPLFGQLGGVIGGIDIGLLPVTAVRNDSLISFDFTVPAQRPAGVGPDNLGVVWTNVLNITTGGDYTFATTTDDGSLLYVDGVLVVQNDFAQGATRRQGTITLSAGYHTVITKLGQGVGGVSVLANYSGADTGNADVLIGSIANTVTNTGTGSMLMGTLTLASDITLSAFTTSTIDVAAAAVTSTGTITFADGAGVKITGITGSETLAQTGAVTLTGANSIQVGTFGVQANASTGVDVTISANIGESVAGSSLIKTGSRTLTLTGTNTFTGALIVGSGTLKIGSATAFSAGTPVMLGQNDASNATLDLNGFSETIGALSTNPGAGVTGTKQILNAGAAVNLTVSQTTDTSYGGLFTGNINLGKQGSGALTLTGGASTFTGGIAVTGGVLGFTADNQLGAASNGISLDGGTLRQALNGQVTLGAARVITVGAGGGAIDVSNVNPGKLFLTAGQIAGAGQLTKSGPGILQLTGANGFTGNWVAGGGQVEVQNTGALGPGSVTVSNGGELVTSSLAIANPIIIGAGGAVLSFDNGNAGDFQGNIAAGGNFNVGLKDFYQNVARNGTISGVISGAGTMTVNPAPAPAELTLTRSNPAWSGGITLGANVRVRAIQGAVFDTLGSGAVTLNGGTLAISPVVSAGATPGFHGRYYNSALITNGVVGGFDFGLLNPVGTRSDLLIDFPYTTGPNFSPLPPVPGLGDQNVGVLWTGVISIATAGSYTFTTGSDDGSLLYIDGAQTVQNDFAQGTTERSGTIALTAGLHPIVVKFANGGGPGGVIADYAGPDTGGGRARIGSILGTLTNTGAAILGSLTMDNAITLSAGVNSAIDLAATNATSTGAMTFQAGSGLTLTGITGYDTLTQAGAVTLNGSGTVTLGITQVAGNIQNASAGAEFIITGAIGEGVAGSSLTKVGPRNLTMSGSASNTFTGALIDNRGTVLLNRTPGANAVGTAGLIINGTFGAGADTSLVRLLASDQIANTGTVTVTTTGDAGARFAMDGFNEAVAAVSITSTTANLAAITTGAGGTLTVNGDIILNNNRPAANNTGRETLITGTGTYAAPASDGTLNLGGALRNITVASTNVGPNLPGSDATIETAIVNGGINKLGARVLILNGASTYAGGTVINDGTVRAIGAAGATSSVLGTGLVTLKGGSLELRNNGTGSNGAITYGNNLLIDASQASGLIDVNNNGANTGNTITLGNLAIGAQTLNVTGGNGYSMRFSSATLSGDATVNLTVAGGSLTLNNVAQTGGARSLTKSATSLGVLILTGSGTYSGGTVVPLGSGPLRLVPTIGTTDKPAGTGPISLATGTTLQITPVISSLTGAGAVQGSLSAKYYNGATTLATGNYAAIPTASTTVALLADGTFFNRPAAITPASATNLLAVYSGLLNITSPGAYSFQTAVQDASQLVIDGVPVISVNTPGGTQVLTDSATSAPITLGAGFHTIVMKAFNGSTGGGFRVRYQGGDTGGNMQVIAPARLYAAPALLNVGNTGSPVTLAAATTITIDAVGSDLDSSVSALTLGTGSVLNAANAGGSGVLSVIGATTLQGAATLNPTSVLLNLTGDLADGGGNHAVTKTGAGALVLTGAKTFGGTLTISAGGVQVTNAASLGGTANGTIVSSGATLDLNGTALGAEPLTLNGAGTGTSAAALYNSSSNPASASGPVSIAAATTIGGFGDLTLGGAVSGSTALTKTGVNTLTLSGGNGGFTGALAVTQGIVKLGSATALGTVAGNTTVSSGATLDLNGQSTSEPLVLLGAGLLNIGSANTLGALINTSGTLSTVSATVALGASSSIGSSSLSGGGAITLAGVVSGVIFNKVGGNTVTMTAANTYTGAGTVQLGTLILSGAGTVTAESSMNVNPTATLTLDDTGTNNTVGSRLGSKTLSLIGGNFNVLGNAGANTLEDIGAGLFRIDTHNSVVTLTPGAGRNVRFNAASLGRTGTFTTKGTALFRGTGLGTATAASLTANTANITFGTAPAPTGQNGAGALRGILPWALVDITPGGPGSSFAAYSATNGLQVLQPADITAALTLNSNIVATSALTAPALGLTINSLTLKAGGGLAIGAGNNITLDSGGVLATATAGISGAGILNTTGGNREIIIHTAGSGTILTIGTPIATTGGLTKAGEGTLRLTAQNTFTGANQMRLNGGTTVLAGGANTVFFPISTPPVAGATATVSTGNVLYVDAGATLDLNGNDQRIGGLSTNATVAAGTAFAGTSGTITNTSGTTANFRFIRSTQSIVPTILAGNLNIQRDGTSTITLTSPSTYTGTTTLTGGTLTLQDGGGLLNTSALAIRRAVLRIDDTLLQTATRVNASAPVGMDGGAIVFLSRSGGTQDVLNLGAMTLNTGASLITQTLGGTTAPTTITGSSTINIASLARSQGATINFTATANNNVQLGDNPRVLLGTGSPALTGGIVGGWATTLGYNSANPLGGNASFDFATYDAVTGFRPAGYTAVFGAGNNVNIEPNNAGGPSTTTLAGGGALANSLRIGGIGTTTSTTLDFSSAGDVLNLQTGGLLSTGFNAPRFIGSSAEIGRLTAGGAAVSGTSELFIHNGANTLTINSQIIDNPNGALVAVVLGGLSQAGTIQLNGSNTYSGTTYVNGVKVSLNSAGIAIPGNLIISGGTANGGGSQTSANQTVKLLASNQIATTANVTVNGGGMLDLNGFNNTINNLTFTADGGSDGGIGSVVQTGAGALTIGGSITAANLLQATTIPVLSGNVTLPAGVHAVAIGTVAGAPGQVGLQINAAVTGGGSLNVTSGVLGLGNTVSTADVNLSAGTTLMMTNLVNLTTITPTIDALTGSGSVAVTATGTAQVQLVVGNDNGSGTFTGTVAGPISLKKLGTGNQTFTQSMTLVGLDIVDGEVTFGDGIAFAPFAPDPGFAPVLVPEPGSVALLLVGALGVLARRRRG